jgi:LCP family protein required for cell wall assembly
VDSTIYRRRSDGQLVGTPENPQVSNPLGSSSVQSSSEISNPRKDLESNPQIVSAAAEGTIYRNSDLKLKFKTTKRKLINAESDAPSNPVSKQALFQKRVKQESKQLKRSTAGKFVFRIGKWFRAIAVFYVTFFLLLGWKTSSALEKTNATPAVSIADTRGTNWLLVGSDSRKGLSAKEMRQLHTGPDVGNARTDVIIIVHSDSNGITLVSLPRDSYVKIPSHTSSDGTKAPARKNKINAAYTFGGAPLLVQTVEENTGLHIDHYMEIGFAGIRDITDSIGGIEICVPKNYNDKNSNLHVKAGCQHMNGKTALAYVRMRYADPTGDIGRIQRQQQYLAAVIHKVATPGAVLNPLRMWSLSGAGASSVVIDEGTGLRDIARLGLAMKGLSGGSGKVLTVPVSDADAVTAAGSSVLWDKAKAAKLFAKLGANQ